jgi:hypothetical protein
LELKQRGVEVAFAFKEKSKILEYYEFKVFFVSDAVIRDFSRNIFITYAPSLIEQCVKNELKVIEAMRD